MTDVQKPQRVDASSYIEVVSVKRKQYKKAIRTGEGILENSVNDLAFRGKKLSQNEKQLQESIQTPVPPGITYKIIGSSVQEQETAVSLRFVENVYVDEILPRGFGEQDTLDNCQVGTNIYYDGEINTEFEELGWNTYAVDSTGTYIKPEYITGFEPVVYDNQRFGLTSTTAINQNNVNLIANPRIEQIYTNNPTGSENDPPPSNYLLEERIANHLENKEIIISENNNAYFSFTVQNSTSNIARLIIGLGDKEQSIDIRPGARNNVRTSTTTGNSIDVYIVAQTSIETASSSLLFGTLITQTNTTTIEGDKRYSVDVVLIDTSENTYDKITDFSSAPASVTNAYIDASKSFFRPPKCSIFQADTKILWWILKRASGQVNAELFDFDGSTCKWAESKTIANIGLEFDVYDAKLVGNTIYVLLTKIIDANEDEIWQRGDLQTGSNKQNLILSYNIATGISTSFDLGAILVNSLRRFTPANRLNEFFAISDDYVYRLAVSNGVWTVAYKTSTRELFTSPPPEQTKMLFPRVVEYNNGSNLDVYNSHRFRDITYDQGRRKLYISLQSRGTVGFGYEVGMNTLDNLPTNAVFVVSCDQNEILRGEQITPNPRPVGSPNFTTVSDLNIVDGDLYFSNADRGIIYRFYNLPVSGIRSLPSATYGTAINKLNISQNGTLIGHNFSTGEITQFPNGSYSYDNIITINSQQQLPEVGLLAITTGPRVAIESRVFLSDFSLCYETVEGIEDSFCIGEQIEFNGQFNSGLAGWITTGYVGLNGTAIEMSSQCQGFSEDPTISQTHFSGGPITPTDTIIQSEDKIKLIADVENISTRDAEIYTTVNGKTKGFIISPGERRIVASSNFVGNDNLATSSIRVKTLPKIKPVLTKKLIAPRSGDSWYAYGLFDNSIQVEQLRNADNATTGSIRHRYTMVGGFVYTASGQQISKSNVAFEEIFFTYADTSVRIESINRAGPNQIYVIRNSRVGIDRSYFLDILDTSTSSLVRSYNITVQGDEFGFGSLANIVSTYDAGRNCILLASSLNASSIYRLDLSSGNITTFSSSFNPSQLMRADSISTDPITGIYYVSVRAFTNDYTLTGTLPDNLRLFNSKPHIVGLDEFGNIVTQTAIYRGDRPIGGATTTDNDYVTESPLHSLTCLNIDGRQFIAWAKNEPIIRNSTAFKRNDEFSEYGYIDDVGYNKQNFIYVVEYKDTLPALIESVYPTICLHNKHLNTFSSLAFME